MQGQLDVLFIDRRFRFVNEVERSVSNQGHQFTIANSTRHAFDLFRIRPRHVVMLVVQSDHRVITAFFKELMRLHGCTFGYVVLLSQDVDVPHLGELLDAGANDFRVLGDTQEQIDRHIHTVLAQASSFLGLRNERDSYFAEMLRHRGYTQNAMEGIIQFDASGMLIDANPAVAFILGYDTEEDLIHSQVHVKELLFANSGMYDQITDWVREEGELRGYEVCLRHRNGDRVWCAISLRVIRSLTNDIDRYEGSLIDIHRRKSVEERLAHGAMHDELTDLPNRTSLIKRIARALRRSESDPSYRFSLITFDIDFFARINESFGMVAGDRLLVRVSRRIVSCLRGTDVLAITDDPAVNEMMARLGGDEFTILLEEIASAESAFRVANRIQEAIKKPMEIEGTEVALNASFGIAISDTHYASPEAMLRDADVALSRAKANGRGRAELFDAEIHERVKRHLSLESALRAAIDRNQLRLEYQPIVDVFGKNVIGFEALVRWDHPQEGTVSPGEFIPIAEESDLINTIGEWVLKAACKQLRDWKVQSDVADDFFINVNMASRQMGSEDTVGVVQDTLRQYGLEPKNLHIELTESSLLTDDATTKSTLNTFDDMGIYLCMDDFGTGYSSLSYLHDLPFRALKIDKSFVDMMSKNERNAEIVQAIVTMGHGLGIDVIAEGVQEKGQLEQLMGMGCPCIQGYLFSRPLTPDAACELLDTGEGVRFDYVG